MTLEGALECLHCKAPFVPARYWQKYCSRYCGYRGWWESTHPEKRGRGRPRKKYGERKRGVVNLKELGLL